MDSEDQNAIADYLARIELSILDLRASVELVLAIQKDALISSGKSKEAVEDMMRRTKLALVKKLSGETLLPPPPSGGSHN